MRCHCGGWGVQSPTTYRVSPCPECALHEAYDAVLDEPVPEDMQAILRKLEAVPLNRPRSAR